MREQRLQSFEARLGEPLPEPYRDYILSSEIVSEADLQIESDWDGRVHAVRTIYGFDDGASDEQLDSLHERIGRVLPTKSFAIASTWGGDMFILFLPSAAREGVFCWSHERKVGDDSVDKVAETFGEFLTLLEVETT